MWKKKVVNHDANIYRYQTNDFNALLRYVNELASHKLGYPVSLLTYLGIVNNQALGIKPGTLANVLLNNVGDPFKDSETSLLEVKRHEREIIAMLEDFYGLEKNDAKGYVTTGGTEGNFAGLWWSKRFLITSGIDDLINTDNLIKLKVKQENALTAELAKIPLNDQARRLKQLESILNIKNRVGEYKKNVQQLLTPTVFFTKGHTHYSIPKIAEILHLNIRAVKANDDGSMDLNDFKKELLLHMGANPKSSVIVIANIGTTITGAIDDIPNIKKTLDALKPKPFYTIHMDGALTGFVLPIIKPFGNIKNYFDELGVNTLAVSAHKYPGLSQPCGIILAKKSFFEKAFEKSERNIEYVGNIQDITITGSRSGLNVLMFYNALCTLGLDKGKEKLTKMVMENLDNAQYLYQKLRDLYGHEHVYYPQQFNILFPKPSLFITKKYQLMITGERATICVLTNVTKELIDEFIQDLKNDQEVQMTQTTMVDYTIHTLGSDDITSTVDLFVKSFCDSEPITKHLGIHYQDYRPFAQEVIQKAAKEGLSKVAVDKHNRVIALAIAEDLSDPFIPHIAHYPKLKPILSLIDQLSKPFMQNRKFLKGKILHIWLAAVDPKHRGVGLSTNIDMTCIENAAHKGFDFAYAEFTNELSENIIHQFQIIKLCNRLNFSDFTSEENDKPFKGLSGAASSYLATIRPGVKLDSIMNCYISQE